MNILLFTTVFHPGVGGIERRTQTLARAFAELGHGVVVATATPADPAACATCDAAVGAACAACASAVGAACDAAARAACDAADCAACAAAARAAPGCRNRGDRGADARETGRFAIVRRPGLARFAALAAWCDVHVQMNVSLRYLWVRLLACAVGGAPTVYCHANAYQRDDGTPALADRLKRAVARRSHGIANSRYTGARVGCPTVIFNPYDDAAFRVTRTAAQRDGELVFLGRLVSQKGCDTLIEALGELGRRHGKAPRLTVIGDGPERASLGRLAVRAGVADRVRFVGMLSGAALTDELNRHRILVVPSRYEEPFGSVALEGLACGLLPVVAERGGLVDAIGRHGLVFPNGDAATLAVRLGEALADPALRERLLAGAAQHLAGFAATEVARRYLEVFEAACPVAPDRRGRLSRLGCLGRRPDLPCGVDAPSGALFAGAPSGAVIAGAASGAVVAAAPSGAVMAGAPAPE